MSRAWQFILLNYYDIEFHLTLTILWTACQARPHGTARASLAHDIVRERAYHPFGFANITGATGCADWGPGGVPAEARAIYSNLREQIHLQSVRRPFVRDHRTRGFAGLAGPYEEHSRQ